MYGGVEVTWCDSLFLFRTSLFLPMNNPQMFFPRHHDYNRRLLTDIKTHVPTHTHKDVIIHIVYTYNLSDYYFPSTLHPHIIAI